MAYDRTPDKYIIGFDIATGMETYMTYQEKADEFQRIGLECVPVLFGGYVDHLQILFDLLDKVSILGGSKIEGIVVKNYTLFTAEKKVAMGKFVSEQFKEIHDADWKERNPTGKDIEQRLIERYRSEARWQKAVQHLRDAGILENSPRDIGGLIREVTADVHKECEEEIKQILFDHFWKNISRGITAGLPEWWKRELLDGLK